MEGLISYFLVLKMYFVKNVSHHNCYIIHLNNNRNVLFSLVSVDLP